METWILERLSGAERRLLRERFPAATYEVFHDGTINVTLASPAEADQFVDWCEDRGLNPHL